MYLSHSVIPTGLIFNTLIGFKTGPAWATQDLDLEINFRHRNSDPRNIVLYTKENIVVSNNFGLSVR